MMRRRVSFLYNEIQLRHIQYVVEIAKHLNRKTKAVEGSQKFTCIVYTFVLLKLYYIASVPSWSKGSWIYN